MTAQDSVRRRGSTAHIAPISDPDRARLQARVQGAFTALHRAGLVRFEARTALPNRAFDLLPLHGPAPFRYSALVVIDRREAEPETFYVLRSRPERSSATPPEIAGPFTTIPFAPAPSSGGTPLAAALSLEDLLRAQNAPAPVAERRPRPLELPPGVPLPPGIIMLDGGATPAALGFKHGFQNPHTGSKLAA